MTTSYKAKSLSGAERRVRSLFKEKKALQAQVESLTKSIDQMDKERLWLAKLASKQPMFDNPLHIWEVEKIRDAILKKNGYI